MVTLNTEQTAEGQRLFFDDGSLAGMLVYIVDGGHWRHLGPDDEWTGPRRSCLQAAEYDALAWAADRENKARKSPAA